MEAQESFSFIFESGNRINLLKDELEELKSCIKTIDKIENNELEKKLFIAERDLFIIYEAREIYDPAKRSVIDIIDEQIERRKNERQ